MVAHHLPIPGIAWAVSDLAWSQFASPACVDRTVTEKNTGDLGFAGRLTGTDTVHAGVCSGSFVRLRKPYRGPIGIKSP